MNPTPSRLAATCAIAASLSAASAFAAPQWTTGSYVQANWTANVSNVFHSATTAYTDFVNGSLPTYKDDGKGGKVTNNASAEIVLSKAARIDELRFWTRWDGGRDGVSVTSVEVKTSENDSWTDLGASAVSYGVSFDDDPKNSTCGTLYAFLANDDGTPLASSVTAVRINFGKQDNDWTYYGEIEAVGAFDDGTWHLSVGEVNDGLGTISISPTSENGWYAAGTDVTVTFTPATDVAFLYWDGSVTDEQKTSSSVVMSMNGNRSLEVKCQTSYWTYDATAKLLTDGLQSFGAKGDLDSIVITSGKDYGGKKELDLRRQVYGGGKIIGIDTDGLKISGYTLETLYLPDTLTYVRRGLGELGLKKIEPFLPDSVTSVGGASFFSGGNNLYGLPLRLGYAKDSDGNSVQTVFEIWNDGEGSIAFKLVTVGPSVDLGPGIIDIPYDTFMTATGIETLQLHGVLTNISQYAFHDIATTKAVTVTFYEDVPTVMDALAFGTPKDYMLRFCVSTEGHSRWKSLVCDTAKVAPWKSLDAEVKAKYWANWPQADGNKRPYGLTTSAATLGDATLPANSWVVCDIAAGAILIVR